MNEIDTTPDVQVHPRQVVTAAVVTVFALVLGSVAVVVGVTGRHASLVRLPASASAATGSTGSLTAGSAGGAQAAIAELAPAEPVAYQLGGPLPALATHAPAYRLDGPASVAAVAKLAAALGLHTPVTVEASGWLVADGTHELQVQKGNGGRWTYTAGVQSPQCVGIAAVRGGKGGIVCEPGFGTGSGSGSSSGSVNGSGPTVSGSVPVPGVRGSAGVTGSAVAGGSGGASAGSPAQMAPGRGGAMQVTPDQVVPSVGVTGQGAPDPGASAGTAASGSASGGTTSIGSAGIGTTSGGTTGSGTTGSGTTGSGTTGSGTTGSGTVMTVPPAVLMCPRPPCPAGAMCSDVCLPPQPVAGLLSGADAIKEARALLTAAGIDLTGADVKVSTGPTADVVTVEPAVGGLPTTGMTTTVTIGAKGIVDFAQGILTATTKLGDYPLVGTAAGFKRLQAGQLLSGGGMRPLPALGMPQSKSASVVTVTGAHLVLAEVYGTDNKAYLEPAYVFETASTWMILIVPAVTDGLLQIAPVVRPTLPERPPATVGPMPAPKTGSIPPSEPVAPAGSVPGATLRTVPGA